VVAIFAYVAMYVARVQTGDIAAISEIPVNLLLAMGISIGTNTAFRAIQSSPAARGQKPSTPSQAKSVFEGDDGAPDLSRIQMLAWTFVAIGIYIVHLNQQILTGPYKTLPDIDAALMVLMGLGEGAFLGKKLFTTDTPILNRLSPVTGKPGDSTTITGQSFGESQGGSLIIFNGAPTEARVEDWKDKEIKFKIPPPTTEWHGMARRRGANQDRADR
jgi:hypothetical protein